MQGGWQVLALLAGERGPLCCFLGRLHDELLDALRRQASEKRQGAKS